MRQCFSGFVRHASRVAAVAAAISSRHDRLLQHMQTLIADYPDSWSMVSGRLVANFEMRVDWRTLKSDNGR